MNPNKYISTPLIKALESFRKSISIVYYAKVESDEFLKLPECGVYFQAGDDGVIAAYRVYYQAVGEYYPASSETKKACLDLETIEDATTHFGAPSRDVPSIKIPGRAPTSPGCEFIVREHVVTVYYDADSGFISYVHVKKKV